MTVLGLVFLWFVALVLLAVATAIWRRQMIPRPWKLGYQVLKILVSSVVVIAATVASEDILAGLTLGLALGTIVYSVTTLGIAMNWKMSQAAFELNERILENHPDIRARFESHPLLSLGQRLSRSLKQDE